MPQIIGKADVKKNLNLPATLAYGVSMKGIHLSLTWCLALLNSARISQITINISDTL